jgi:hypothetical protein
MASPEIDFGDGQKPKTVPFNGKKELMSKPNLK